MALCETVRQNAKMQSGEVIPGHFGIKAEKGITWITTGGARRADSYRKLCSQGHYGFDIISQSSDSM